MTKRVELEAVVGSQHLGKRCDQIAAELFSDFSRARLRACIESGALLADGNSCTPRQALAVGTVLLLRTELLPPITDATSWQAEDIDIDIVHEDEDLIIVNKMAGMVVHPATGNRDGTLVNALLYRYPELKELARAGIVHRLDKETSGLLMVARNESAHHHLSRDLQNHKVLREYRAVVTGHLMFAGKVEEPIGRDPKHRMRMAVVRNGKPACTHYDILRHYDHFTYIGVRLETGRTHQIRVHMKHLGHPVVGDAVYGKTAKLSLLQPNLVSYLQGFKHNALHAMTLGLSHPRLGTEMLFKKRPPEDMRLLLEALDEEVT